MSSLSKLIEHWRNEVVAADAFQPEDLAELEQHLRESVDELRALGLSDEEAFSVASSRLGGFSELQTEYSKVDPSSFWRRRVSWMLMGFVAFRFFEAVVGIIGTGAYVVAAAYGIRGDVLGGAIAASYVLAWSLIIYSMSPKGFLATFGRVSKFLRSPVYQIAIIWTFVAISTRFVARWGWETARTKFEGGLDQQALHLIAWTDLCIVIVLPVVCLILVRKQVSSDLQSA